MTASTRRGWLLAASVLLLSAGSLIALAVWNPFWILQRATDAYLWFHGVRGHSVTVDGNRIHYIEARPPAGSPEKPLLLVHGLGARAADWSILIPRLAANGYHVYAPDLLGYGDSAKPEDGDFSIRGEERVVQGFMDRVGLQRADVAGWSMGGWVSMKLALDHPQRVQRLLLYDSAGLYFRLDFPRTLFSPDSRASLYDLLERLEPNKMKIQVPALFVPGMLRRFEKNRWILDRTLASMLAGPDVLDFRVYQLKMPMLIVWGTEDRLIPFSSAERLHELVSQSVLVGIPGCGHLVVAECADRVLPPTLHFLSESVTESPSTVAVSQTR